MYLRHKLRTDYPNTDLTHVALPFLLRELPFFLLPIVAALDEFPDGRQDENLGEILMRKFSAKERDHFRHRKRGIDEEYSLVSQTTDSSNKVSLFSEQSNA
jgi:hypothetical protein